MTEAAKTVVIDPEGNPGFAPAENVEAAKADGFVVAPPDVAEAYTAKARDIAKREQYNPGGVAGFLHGRAAETLGQVRGLAESAFIPFDTVATKAAGLISPEAEQATREKLQDYKDYRPAESATGEIGGLLLPALVGNESGLAKLGSKASSLVGGLGEAGASLGSRVARTAVMGAARGAAEGAALSAVSSANDQSLRDGNVSVEKFLADTGMGLGVGAMGGLLLGGAGTLAGAAVGKAMRAGQRQASRLGDVLERSSRERLLDEVRPSAKLLENIIRTEGPEAVPTYAGEIIAATKEAGVNISKLSPDEAYRVSMTLEKRAQAALAELEADTVPGIAPLDEASKAALDAPSMHDVDAVSKAFDKAASRAEKVANALEDDTAQARANQLRQRVTALQAWNDSMVRDISRLDSGGASRYDSVFSLPSKVGYALGGSAGGAIGGYPGALVGGVTGGAVGRVLSNAVDNSRPHFISGLLDRAGTWARMQEATLSMDAKVADGVASFLSGKAPGAAKAVVGLFNGEERERDRKVKRHVDTIENLTTNQAAMTQHTAKVTAAVPHAPEVAPQLASKVSQNILALRARLPKNRMPQVGPFANLNDARYADNEVAAYERYLATVADPMEAVRALKRGNLTKDHVDALKETAPEVYQSFVKALVEHAGTGEPGMQSQEQLYQLFGVPMSAHQDPALVNAVQGAYLADANKRQEGSQGGGSQAKPGNLSKTSASPSDRLDER